MSAAVAPASVLDAPRVVPSRAPTRYRTLWLSDLHLGTPGCEAEALLAFLQGATAERIYLVGDIVDLWRLQARPYWPRAHVDVLGYLLRLARDGTAVLYLPGNHDDALRRRIGTRFGRVAVVDDLVHTTVDGRRFLVLHGDGFDVVSQHAKWLWHLGARVYSVLQRANQLVNNAVFSGARRRLRVSGFLKHTLKRSVNMIGRYEAKFVREARQHGVDGIICGHIHRAELRDIAGITYANIGDWVESCTRWSNTTTAPWRSWETAILPGKSLSWRDGTARHSSTKPEGQHYD
jgi:UDP-2,3-diacylglucosamine pyrophosphatase LpxH